MNEEFYFEFDGVGRTPFNTETAEEEFEVFKIDQKERKIGKIRF